MAEEQLDKLGPLMNEIGVEGTAIVGGDPDGLYIYAEPDGGAVYAAVFREEPEIVRYFDPTHELFEIISEAWEVEPNLNRRWVVMEYEVRGASFSVELRYPEELKAGEDSTDRRRAALKRRYGEKPVIYPPIPEHFEELKRD